MLDETTLWRLLAEEIQHYQKQFPQLKDVKLFDLSRKADKAVLIVIE
ncbi:hypothetical protein R0I01_18015 [Bacillus pumilus]|nr:hypothetical protein R0I01_18015 [Bacillus pumilus]